MSRKAHITKAQKLKLFEIIANKPELRSGKFSDKFTFKHAQNEWKQISETLNSIPGSQKDWKEWRKTWQDLMSKTKKKVAEINRIRRGTGGGPPPAPLDDFEEGVSSLINTNSVTGHSGVEESVVFFTDEVATTSAFIENVIEDNLNNDNHIDANVDHSIEITIPPPIEFSEHRESVPVVDANRAHASGRANQKKINMKTLLKEKVELKKKMVEAKLKFYEKYLEIQNQRNNILRDISNNLMR